MYTKLIAVASLGIGIGCVHSAAADDSLRCGNKLVAVGDTRSFVRSICGSPTDISLASIQRTRSVVWRGTQTRHSAPRLIDRVMLEVPTETWIYNFGPHRFMMRLRFVDGVLETMDTLNYGYIE